MIEGTRALLTKYGIRPNKRLDQHFLSNENYIQKEIDAANITKNDVVLEIGPGVGTLTQYLLEKAKKVVAVELDKNLANVLRQRFPEKNFSLIEGDALKTEIPEFDMCVSNIPYSISSKIIVLIGKLGKPAVLMFQKEFAERIIAKPGTKNYSRISIASQYYFEAKKICKVPKTAYFPKPKIDSAIVRLVPRKDKLDIGNEDFFFNVVRALFTHKNQTARNALIHSRKEFGLDKKQAQKVFGLVPYADEKPRTLPIEKIAKMSIWLKGALS